MHYFPKRCPDTASESGQGKNNQGGYLFRKLREHVCTATMLRTSRFLLLALMHCVMADLSTPSRSRELHTK